MNEEEGRMMKEGIAMENGEGRGVFESSRICVSTLEEQLMCCCCWRKPLIVTGSYSIHKSHHLNTNYTNPNTKFTIPNTICALKFVFTMSGVF